MKLKQSGVFKILKQKKEPALNNKSSVFCRIFILKEQKSIHVGQIKGVLQAEVLKSPNFQNQIGVTVQRAKNAVQRNYLRRIVYQIHSEFNKTQKKNLHQAQDSWVFVVTLKANFYDPVDKKQWLSSIKSAMEKILKQTKPAAEHDVVHEK